MYRLEARIQGLESTSKKRAKIRSKWDPHCICYPEGNVPVVLFEILTRVAFSLKCPLHGDRFSLNAIRAEYFVAQWVREKIANLAAHRVSGFSERYYKAYFASFPTDLWPASEEREENAMEGCTRTYLRLKDGTRFHVSPAYFAKPSCEREDVAPTSDVHRRWIAERGKGEDATWEMETLRIVGRLLSARGGIVDLSGLGRKEWRTRVQESKNGW